MLVIDSKLRIPLDELRFSFVKSSGPGGQNVNKLNTKAELRWNAVGSPSLRPDVLARLLARFPRRITSEGELLITSQRFRTQARNVEDCLDKLREILSEVARPPKPRRPTRPTHAAKARRLKRKHTHARKKESRRRDAEDE